MISVYFMSIWSTFLTIKAWRGISVIKQSDNKLGVRVSHYWRVSQCWWKEVLTIWWIFRLPFVLLPHLILRVPEASSASVRLQCFSWINEPNYNKPAGFKYSLSCLTLRSLRRTAEFRYSLPLGNPFCPPFVFFIVMKSWWEAVTQSPSDGSLCLPLGWARKGMSSFRCLPAAATMVSIHSKGWSWEMRSNPACFREQLLEEPRAENSNLGLKDLP